MDTYLPNDAFNFDTISLANPQPVQGGTYFTKLSVGSNPCYIQLPKCLMKQGIVETKRGKYCDLLYVSSDENELTTWISKLEEKCQNLIHEQKNTWFHNELTKDDIESMLSSIFRLYRGGQQLLLRTHIDINRQTGIDKCVAYDEKHIKQDLKNLDIKKYIIPLICIEGIKLSSKSFEFDTKLLQIMILEPEPEPTDVCLIKHTSNLNLNESVSLGNLLNTKADLDMNADNSLNMPQMVEVENENKTSTENILKQEEPAKQSDMTQQNKESEKSELNQISSTDEIDKQNKDVEKDKNQDEAVVEAVNEAVTEAVIEAVNGGDDEGVEQEKEKENENENENDKNQDKDVVEAVTEAVNGGDDEGVEQEKKEENMNTIEEIEPVIADGDDSVRLKDPNEVYYEIYRAARDKAKHMRRIAIEAFLEAKDIKTKYLLDDIEDSDEEEEI